jgi:hypothetical protein
MRWFAVVLITVSLQAFDLDAIRKETNAEKRSDLALNNASTALDSARTASQAGDLEATRKALDEVDASIGLMRDSLVESGKDARRSKYFKRAEVATRQMLRRLDGLADALSIDDRSMAEKVRDHVASVHEELLTGVMGKRK